MSSPRLRRTLGIDLGTTNSVIACLDDSTDTLLTGHDTLNNHLMPSLVAWHPTKAELITGHEAKTLPDNVLPLSSVKRTMGLSRTFDMGPHTLTPVEVSAVILRALREWMARVLPPTHFLDSAVITMPAYFNHSQIEATREAGERAGYEVRELLHEPTAAALYYSWLEKHKDATYLVYDLGGGTFDVSIIRRRLDDHEVIAVSGDPFLGGDDFDRTLAAHLVESAQWKDENGSPVKADTLLGPTSHAFARLVRIAESIKMELSSQQTVTRTLPSLSIGERHLTMYASISRSDFERLIRPQVSRTIDCCHEAIGRAKEKAGLRLEDIDHVILVGGSSRVPLVRQFVLEAFAKADKRRLLCHEPDLCVAYGAALRAATQGTRYLFPVDGKTLEFHVTSPTTTNETSYLATGVIRSWAEGTLPSSAQNRAGCLSLDGSSVRLRSTANCLVEEVFLDERGSFAQPVEIVADSDTPLDWTWCDADGNDRTTLQTVVRHRSIGQVPPRGVLATQLITRPLSILVLTRGRQRIKQMIAPIGSALPGSFRCVCRTTDQSGRIVMPVYEDNRVIKQLVIDELDQSLPIGSPVEVEFRIDATHRIEVALKLRESRRNRVETVCIEPPVPPPYPTREEIEETIVTLRELVQQLTGRQRARLRERADQVYRDLIEAFSYNDEAKTIARMAELRELQELARMGQQVLDPPWPRLAALVRECLTLASRVSEQTGRDRDELCQYVLAQERYAEQAHDEHNPSLYRECWENLEKYARYLSQLLDDTLPGKRANALPTPSPEIEAREELNEFRQLLTQVWKRAREKKRADLDYHLGDIARAAAGLSTRMKDDPHAGIREARRLILELQRIAAQMIDPAPPSPDEGLLEGST